MYREDECGARLIDPRSSGEEYLLGRICPDRGEGWVLVPAFDLMEGDLPVTLPEFVGEHPQCEYRCRRSAEEIDRESDQLLVAVILRLLERLREEVLCGSLSY